MLNSIALAIDAGINASVLLALTYLVIRNKRVMFSSGIIGIFIGSAAMFVLMIMGDRELMDMAIDLTVLIATLAVIIGSLTNREALFSKTIFIYGALVLAEGTYKFLLYPRNIFIQTKSYLNTDLLLIIMGATVGLTLLLAIAGAVAKTGLAGGKSWHRFYIVGVAILGLEPLVQIVRYVFVSGLLPLTDLVMIVLIPIINNMGFFQYLVFAIMLWFVALVFNDWRRIKPAVAFSNPADKRKFYANKLVFKRWINSIAALILILSSVLAGNYALANQKVELSPAQPITAEEGKVVISQDTVNDGALHRFAYSASGGVEVRFLVIHKGSSIYGIGLDACDICGTAGYYQRKDNVICANCDVIISTPTIGFPGGCNPIPLEYEKNDNTVTIAVDQLEKASKVFAQ